MYSDQTNEKIMAMPMIDLYNKCIMSANIQYDESRMSAIYFLMQYNEEQAKKCLLVLLQYSMSENDALKELNLK